MIESCSTPFSTPCNSCPKNKAVYTLRIGNIKDSYCTVCLSRLIANLSLFLSAQLSREKWGE